MIKHIASFAIASLALVSTAQAATEAWHLEGTIYQATSSAVNIPDGLRVGQSFTVDYLVDNAAQSNGYFISGAIQQISVNGVSTAADGYIAEGGLGLNVTPSSPILGLNFVSFNALNLLQTSLPAAPSSVDELLSQYGRSPLTNDGDIRFDFEGQNYPSVWGHVTSFAPAVPEPSTSALGVLGFAALMAAVRRNRAK